MESNHGKKRRNLKCILLSERSQGERATYCDSTTWCSVKGWTTEIMRERKTEQCWPKEWEDFQGMAQQRIFRGEYAPFNITMTDICHYVYVQAHRMYKTKNEPQSKYGLWVIWLWCDNVGSMYDCTLYHTRIQPTKDHILLSYLQHLLKKNPHISGAAVKTHIVQESILM